MLTRYTFAPPKISFDRGLTTLILNIHHSNMKRLILLTLISALFTFSSIYAQNKIDEKGFSYQGYARSADGVALANSDVTVRFTITVKGSSTVLLQEEHLLKTDLFGVFHTIIGTKKPVDYKALSFHQNNYELKVEVKTPTTNYSVLSNAELLAVPYAKAAGNGNPPGTILPFAGDKVPEGYLLCDGRSLSKEDYPALHANIGTAWGGNATNFNLPDLRGMFLRGVDGGSGNDPDAADRLASNAGGNTGNKVGTTQDEQIKSHKHDASSSEDGKHNHLGGQTNTGYAFTNNRNTVRGTDDRNRELDLKNLRPHLDAGEHSHTITVENTGGSETRPKNAAVLYIIKY